MKYEIINDDYGHNIWDDLEKEWKFISNHRNYNSINTEYKIEDFESEEEIEETYSGYNVVKVYAYIHSGIALSLTPFQCRWDSGVFGCLVYPTDINSVEGFVKEWGMNWNGENYGYVITDENGEELESVWGFIGTEYCEEEAKSSLQWYKKDAKKKREERVKTLIRNRVPLEVRQKEIA